MNKASTKSLRFCVCAFVLVLTLQSPLAAREWFVFGTGNDSNNGTSLTTAFASLAKAAHAATPGDTIWVGEGIYTDTSADSDSAIVTLSKHGSPDAWTTLKAVPGARAELRPSKGWQGIFINGSYIIIDGLHITGANDSITLLDATADGAIKEKEGRPYSGAPRFNTNGITIEGRKSAPDKKPHHIIIRNCTISKMPGAGITMMQADYMTVEDCTIFSNAWFMRYGGSGISTLRNWQHDNEPGYHIIIQRNLVWDNKTLVPWTKIGKHSDGNGIILDVTDDLPSGATNPNADKLIGTATAAPAPAIAGRPTWTARTLVANNVSAFNGGSGIHAFRAKHIDIINNTTYWNGGIVGYQELFANRSEDIVILNNIIVPRPGGKVTSEYRNKDIHWDYNLYSVAQDIYKGPNDIVADPKFVLIDSDPRKGGFRLQTDSPAIGSGTKKLAQPTDVTGTPRPVAKAPNRGAYE